MVMTSPERHSQRHTWPANGRARSILPGAGWNLHCNGGGHDDEDRCSRRAGPFGRRGQGRLGAAAGQVAGPVLVPCPRWQDVPAQTGRRTCGRRRARRGGRVRGAGSESAGRGSRFGRVPADQSLAGVAVSANVDSPAVGSDRGSSPGGRRGRALEEAAPGRCPGGSDAAEGIAGVGGQDVRAAWPAGGDGTGRDLAWQGRCPRAEFPQVTPW